MFEKDEFNNSPNNVMNNNYLMNKSKLEETTKPTEKNRSVFSEKQNVHNFSMNAVVPSKESNNQQNERRMSQSSLSKGVIPTQGVCFIFIKERLNEGQHSQNGRGTKAFCGASKN